MKAKLMGVALLLLVGLPVGMFFREVGRVSRDANQIHDAIQIGTPIKDIGIFGNDAQDACPHGCAKTAPGKTEFVICTAQKDGPSLRQDDWSNLVASKSGFPPACQTMEVWIRGVPLGPGDNLFDLEFDKSWGVSKIGMMRTNLRG